MSTSHTTRMLVTGSRGIVFTGFRLIAVASVCALPATTALAQDTTSTPVDTSYVEYRESPIRLPLGVGLRTPSYDRVDGLTLPWGPQLTLGDDKLVADALVSYRSHLGDWDPSIEATARPGYANEVKLFVGRTTFTNDSWIRKDIVNSAAVLFVGSDARNYYRTDRAALRYTRSLTAGSVTLTPFVGGSIENDWSTGAQLSGSAPWSFYGRNGVLRMRRPNPTVDKRHIGAVLAGSALEYFRDGVTASLAGTVEIGMKSGAEVFCLNTPGGTFCPRPFPGFTQTTVDSHADFPTFGSQTLNFRGHAILTGGKGAPPQRYGYLGGSGTLATVDLLALGGDRLLYVEGDYKIPLGHKQLPYVGGPFVALHYAAGNAGIGQLPPLIQNIGMGAGFGLLRVDYAIDPAQNRSPFSRRSAVTFGLSL